jgi:hypothetical protein
MKMAKAVSAERARMEVRAAPKAVSTARRNARRQRLVGEGLEGAAPPIASLAKAVASASVSWASRERARTLAAKTDQRQDDDRDCGDDDAGQRRRGDDHHGSAPKHRIVLRSASEAVAPTRI